MELGIKRVEEMCRIWLFIVVRESEFLYINVVFVKCYCMR